MPTSGKRGSRAVVEVVAGKGAKTLPRRSALNAVAKGKKTINDYSKAGASIDDYPPAKPR